MIRIILNWPLTLLTINFIKNTINLLNYNKIKENTTNLLFYYQIKEISNEFIKKNIKFIKDKSDSLEK